MREAMLEVYIPTKDLDKIPGLDPALLTELRSKPATLKKLCRDSVRKSMRILTGGRTIKPLVAKLENLNVITWDGQKMPLPETLGNFLLCDPPVNWRKQMVINKKSDCLFVNICVPGCHVGLQQWQDLHLHLGEAQQLGEPQCHHVGWTEDASS